MNSVAVLSDIHGVLPDADALAVFGPRDGR
ncbi:hypothetical protein FBZ33_5953 [Micromonospora sp. A202]|nr:hypothetical protein FBZ33_5953 [Micromonospora sp. A202]